MSAVTVVILLALTRAPAVEVAPAPRWVDPIALETGSGPSDRAVDYLLYEEQIRLGPPAFERYLHTARRVNSPDAVENGSELRFEYDPSHQRLVLHGVWIHRNGHRTSALRVRDIKLLQREEDLDARHYDGRLTALLYLHDVRPGDIVESAYTIRGSNPVFGGRAAGWAGLAYGPRVARLRVRMLRPVDRFLATRVHGITLEPAIATGPDGISMVWDRRDVPELPREGQVPGDVDVQPWVEYSEWRDWREVAEWGAGLFAVGSRAHALAPVVEFRKAADPTERASAALRFAQEQVRYLAVELGPGTHRPSPPEKVLARRYGDCKDKSLLLVSFLRSMGIEADPALTHTEDGAAMDRRLPSPFVFDHVIVLARLEGKERWLEPTRIFERSPANEVEPPDYARALVLKPGTTALSEIPRPPANEKAQTERVRIVGWGKPVSFRVSTRYAGDEAMQMRRTLANASAKRLEERYLRYYAEDQPDIRLDAPLRVEDAPGKDELVISESYVLPPAGDDQVRDFTASSLDERLVAPRTTRRQLPLEVEHPVRLRETLILDIPGRPAVQPGTVEERGPAGVLRRSISVGANTVEVVWTYESLRDRVEPSDLQRHLASLKEMRELATIRLPLRPRPPPTGPTRSVGEGLGMLAGIVFVGLGLIFGVTRAVRWARSLRGRRFVARTRPRNGESAMSPLLVHDRAAALAAARTLRCACGGRLGGEPESTEAVRYGGGEVMVSVLVCPACTTRRGLYWVAPR